MAAGLTRVECKIFPALAQANLPIPTYAVTDGPVVEAQARIHEVATKNFAGPETYIKIFDAYTHLLPDASGKSKVLPNHPDVVNRF